MNKDTFIRELKKELKDLNPEELRNLIIYYEESILDRMEDGISEEDAVRSLGSFESIVDEAKMNQSIPELIQGRVNKTKETIKNGGVWMPLVILGSPLWILLILAFFIIILSVFIVLGALLFSLYAVIFALGTSVIAMCIRAATHLMAGSFAKSMFTLGELLIALGLIFLLLNPARQFTFTVKMWSVNFLNRVKRLIRG